MATSSNTSHLQSASLIPQVNQRAVAVIPLFLIIVLDIMSIYLIMPILAIAVVKNTHHIFGLQASSAYRHHWYGILIALATACYMIATPILGYFADQVGRRRVLLICVLGTLLGLLGYIFAFMFASLSILVLARIVLGITSGSVAIGQAAIAEHTHGVEKAKRISLIAIALTIGLFAGPLLGGVLSDASIISWFNVYTPFYVGIIFGGINLIILLRYFFSTTDNQLTKKPLGQELKQLGKQFVEVIFYQNTYYILLIYFLMELGWGFYSKSIGLLLAECFNASPKMIASLSSYTGVTMSLALFFGVNAVVKYLRLTGIVPISLLVGAVAYLLGFFHNDLLTQWLMATPIAIAVACSYALLATQASDCVPPYQQGLLMGILDALLALAFTIAGLATGWLSVISPALPELIAGFCFISGFILYPLARYQYRQQKIALS